ncbi:MAG: substrate-binding domain-containing protein [Pseudomonadota bacterium]
MGTAMLGVAVTSTMTAAPTMVRADQVTLTTDKQNVTIIGELLSFQNGIYLVETIIGEITLSGTDVRCQGPGCPPGATPPTVVDRSIVLTNDAADVRLEGEFVSLEDDVYTIRTEIGVFELAAEGAICAGPGCPVAPIDEALPSPTTVAASPTARNQDGSAGRSVILTNAEADVRLEGRFISLEDGIYRIETVIGTFDLQQAGTVCEGAGCPVTDLVIAEVDPIGVVQPILADASSPLIPIPDLDGPADLTVTGPASILTPLLPIWAAAFADTRAGEARAVASRLVSASEAVARDYPAGALGVTLAGTRGGDVSVRGRFAPTGAESRALLDGGADLALFTAGRDALIDGDAVPLAADAAVALVSPRNPVAALSPLEMSEIFAGRIRNWAEVGGEDRQIRVIGLPQSHDSARALQTFVMAPAGAALREPDTVVPTDRALAEAVAADPTAIGFASFAARSGARPVDLLQSCGIRLAATEDSIVSRRYPFTRTILLDSRAAPPLAAALVATLQAPQATVLSDAGFPGARVDRQSLSTARDAVARAADDSTDPTKRARLEAVAAQMRLADRLNAVFYFRSEGRQLDTVSQALLPRAAAYLADNQVDEFFVIGFSDEGTARAESYATAIRQALTQADESGALTNAFVRTVALTDTDMLRCPEARLPPSGNDRVEIWLRR